MSSGVVALTKTSGSKSGPQASTLRLGERRTTATSEAKPIKRNFIGVSVQLRRANRFASHCREKYRFACHQGHEARVQWWTRRRRTDKEARGCGSRQDPAARGDGPAPFETSWERPRRQEDYQSNRRSCTRKPGQ